MQLRHSAGSLERRGRIQNNFVNFLFFLESQYFRSALPLDLDIEICAEFLDLGDEFQAEFLAFLGGVGLY